MDTVVFDEVAPTDLAGINSALSKLSVSFQLDKFLTNILLDEFNRYNKVLGLSSVKGNAETFAKHFFESALLASLFSSLSSNQIIACDLGTGNGFPGLVLASVFPNWSFSLIESSMKRSAYLESTLAAMNIKNVTVDNLFLEEAPDSLRSKYDLITYRAFASLEHTLKLTRKIGTKTHIVAGFSSEFPNQKDLSMGYQIEKLIKYRNYKNKIQFIYMARILDIV